jgi:hypothetical protein
MDIPPHNPDLVVPTDGFFDPDASNGLRARSAHVAIIDYQEKRGLDSDENACAIDLLTDILHFIHSLGESPLGALDTARGHFVAEACGTAPQIA